MRHPIILFYFFEKTNKQNDQSNFLLRNSNLVLSFPLSAFQLYIHFHLSVVMMTSLAALFRGSSINRDGRAARI
jgi:hypothetical protein